MAIAQADWEPSDDELGIARDVLKWFGRWLDKNEPDMAALREAYRSVQATLPFSASDWEEK